MKTCVQLLLKWLAASLLLAANFAHAQTVTACPPGMVPYGAGTCGYDQGATSSPQNPAPPPVVWKNNYLSIASDNVIGRLGISTEMPDQNSSDQAALADCRAHGGTHCKIDLSVRNGCGAIVAGGGIGGYNVQGGSTLVEAIQKGMAVCTKAGETNCHATYQVCSLPQAQ
jgi:hypothetical protein